MDGILHTGTVWLDTKMDTILDTERVISDCEKYWHISPVFCRTARHSFLRKCSAILCRNLFIWCSYRMECQTGKTAQIRQLAPAFAHLRLFPCAHLRTKQRSSVN